MCVAPLKKDHIIDKRNEKTFYSISVYHTLEKDNIIDNRNKIVL